MNTWLWVLSKLVRPLFREHVVLGVLDDVCQWKELVHLYYKDSMMAAPVISVEPSSDRRRPLPLLIARGRRSKPYPPSGHFLLQYCKQARPLSTTDNHKWLFECLDLHCLFWTLISSKKDSNTVHEICIIFRVIFDFSTIFYTMITISHNLVS